MPDILIRGMEMPDGCHNCGFSYFDKWETNDGEPCTVLMCSAMNQGTNGAEYDGNRPFWCPLVPLPEGHGRLIDADAVVKTICNSCDGACDVVQCDCLNCKADCRCDIVKEISDAPTIIEADIEWKMKNCCCFSNTDQAEGGTENADTAD